MVGFQINISNVFLFFFLSYMNVEFSQLIYKKLFHILINIMHGQISPCKKSFEKKMYLALYIPMK